MRGAQAKSDTRWGAGVQAWDRWSADVKDRGCSAVAPDLQAKLRGGLGWGATFGHWGFHYEAMGDLLLLERKEEPQSPAKVWGATKTATKQPSAWILTKVS